MSLYKIIIEVEGTPVETDELLKKFRSSPPIVKILRKLKPDEDLRDVVYKMKLEDC